MYFVLGPTTLWEGNWIIQTGASDEMNSVLRNPMLEQMTACAPALSGFVAKWYGERPVSDFFQMHSEIRIKLESSRRINKRNAVGPALFCLPLRLVLMRFREKTSRRGSKPKRTSTGDITITARAISPGTAGVVPPLG